MYTILHAYATGLQVHSTLYTTSYNVAYPLAYNRKVYYVILENAWKYMRRVQ